MTHAIVVTQEEMEAFIWVWCISGVVIQLGFYWLLGAFEEETIGTAIILSVILSPISAVFGLFNLVIYAVIGAIRERSGTWKV